MKHFYLFIFVPLGFLAQVNKTFTNELASKLAEKPLHCISLEYPNKTGHIINSADDAYLSPKELHPSFYGCFDWHSSVHGHWMLVRLLKTRQNIPNAAAIEKGLETSLTAENLKAEAFYFDKFPLNKTFERTYGWAWLLKLDQELITWNDNNARKWHQNLQPLTEKVVKQWTEYLPKQTYPNRTGVHPNTAFALAFALDWARATKNENFEKAIIDKAKIFFLNDKKTPAYLEPDGSDFFSPSLEIADLMRRILPQKEFVKWLNHFYDKKSLENIEKIPVVSDLDDYQTVHLVGLSFSRAWCMKGIASALPENHRLKKRFENLATAFLKNGLPLLFKGNYGADHWLASFAVYALE